MALRPEVVGETTDTLVHQLEWKDAVLYALGVGAKRDELDYLYEGRGPRVLPTYAVIPTFPAKIAATANPAAQASQPKAS